ncbi:MAG: hypothetical protein ABFD54_16255 [Armatimonadota bacterium]|nr:hypothetical protein [bacterium]
MKRYGVLLTAFTLLILLSVAAEPSDIPTTAFLVAALKYQEQESGLSLEVNYRVDAVGEPKVGSGRSEIRYVRTPQSLFLEESQFTFTASGEWKLANTAKYSYDRRTRKYRTISTHAREHAKTYAQIETTSMTRFAQNTVLDPARFSLVMTPLYDRVSSGEVRPKQEMIDGHACWRIDIAPSDVGCVMVGWSVWLDPEIGYCPRRIAQTNKQDAKTTTKITTFGDYKLLAGDVWFPMEMIADYGDGSGLQITVQNATAGRDIPQSDLRVDFPSGTCVTDKMLDSTYTIP